MKKPGITVLVHSTDRFSDCWDPFFLLMAAYWPDCRYPIVLNAETRTYSHETLSIRCSRIAAEPGSPWPTWSESLLRCLDKIETEHVLFLLEDFFISGPVDTRSLEWAVAAIQDGGYSSITLTEHGKARPAEPGPGPRLLAIRQDARYRLNTSPALWRVDALRRYLRPAENAWQFEVFGSWRARRSADSFLLVDPGATPGGEGVIPYFQAVHNTGIVKDRWQRGVEDLFRRHGIKVDFSVRGFHKPHHTLVNKFNLVRNLAANPVAVLAGFLGS